MSKSIEVLTLMALRESGPGHIDPEEVTPQAWRDGVDASIAALQDLYSAPTSITVETDIECPWPHDHLDPSLGRCPNCPHVLVD